MRSLRIFALGTAVVLLALTVRLWAKGALIAIAALPLVFLVIGQFMFPRPRRGIQVWMNPEVIERLGKVTLRLSGKVVPLGFFKSWHEFKIEVCNFWLLATISFLSLGALAGVSSLNEIPIPGASVYYGASAWSPVCYVAWRWIWERRAMLNSGIALGSFRVTRFEKPFMKRVVYRFNDKHGGYRAGSIRSLFCDTRDDLTVVFYDESNPEISAPASAMMFHKLKWAEPGLPAS